MIRWNVFFNRYSHQQQTTRTTVLDMASLCTGRGNQRQHRYIVVRSCIHTFFWRRKLVAKHFHHTQLIHTYSVLRVRKNDVGSDCGIHWSTTREFWDRCDCFCTNTKIDLISHTFASFSLIYFILFLFVSYGPIWLLLRY